MPGDEQSAKEIDRYEPAEPLKDAVGAIANSGEMEVVDVTAAVMESGTLVVDFETAGDDMIRLTFDSETAEAFNEMLDEQIARDPT